MNDFNTMSNIAAAFGAKVLTGPEFAYTQVDKTIWAPLRQQWVGNLDMIAFLHELGHHVNGMTSDKHLQDEVLEWETARTLANTLGIEWPEEADQLMEVCLESYAIRKIDGQWVLDSDYKEKISFHPAPITCPQAPTIANRVESIKDFLREHWVEATMCIVAWGTALAIPFIPAEDKCAPPPPPTVQVDK